MLEMGIHFILLMLNVNNLLWGCISMWLCINGFDAQSLVVENKYLSILFGITNFVFYQLNWDSILELFHCIHSVLIDITSLLQSIGWSTQWRWWHFMIFCHQPMIFYIMTFQLTSNSSLPSHFNLLAHSGYHDNWNLGYI